MTGVLIVELAYCCFNLLRSSSSLLRCWDCRLSLLAGHLWDKCCPAPASFPEPVCTEVKHCYGFMTLVLTTINVHVMNLWRSSSGHCVTDSWPARGKAPVRTPHTECLLNTAIFVYLLFVSTVAVVASVWYTKMAEGEKNDTLQLMLPWEHIYI